jgi:hypothetical protein
MAAWNVLPARRRTAPYSAAPQEILEQSVDSRRNRNDPRAVRRKMSKFPIRPRGKQPTVNIDRENAIWITQ